MTNAVSPALAEFIGSHSFTSLSILSLVAVAVLLVLVIELEVLRVVRPDTRVRDARIFGLAIYPLAILAAMLIIVRFVNLG